MSELFLFEAALLQRGRSPLPRSLHAIKVWLAANRERIAGLADVDPADGYVAYLTQSVVIETGEVLHDRSGVAIPVAVLEEKLTAFGEPTAIIGEWMREGYVMTDTSPLQIPGHAEPIAVYRISVPVLTGLNHGHPR